MSLNALEPKKQVAYFTYDFDKHGGAVGAISVQGDGIPAGAIITSGVVHVKTACTSGGSATVSIGIATAADMLAATAVASLTANALLDVVPDGTATNMVRLTSADNTAIFTVATAALTAGKIVLAVEYFVTD
ncbi:MAG: hypothetical protein DRP56_06240 [Planctomycetota bacterium]|nr:MAG: hypothetical protein DRP56_06240 [Planctomycetota bacterium]